MNKYEKKDEDKNMTRDELLKRINNKEYESNTQKEKLSQKIQFWMRI